MRSSSAELGKLAAAEACAVEEFQHGAITDAEWVADVGDGNDGFDLVEAERFFREAFFGTWEFEFRGWICGDVVAFDEIGKEVFHGAESAALGANTEGFAVVLLPSPEVALVAFQDELGDGVRFC